MSKKNKVLSNAELSAMRNQVRLVKLLPHRLVMDIWMKQQKHNKLPDED